MAQRDDRIYCGRCGHEVQEAADSQFLGFTRFTCETCEAPLTGPLVPPAHTAARVAAIAGLALADVLLLARHEAPGLIALGVALVALGFLSANQRITRAHRVRGRNVWLSQLARRTGRFTESAHSAG
ncbi:MAG: hypothetical protein OEW44_09360 [Gemmatimonadota bacterium]|jgi:hypothetical protein|nr:hypothetical protein [Gemmatimonadota bacterium]